MARGLTGQTVLLAALLAALAGSQIALAQSDSDDDMQDVPVTVGRRQIKQPTRLTSTRTVRATALDDADDTATPTPAASPAKPNPWAEDVSPSPQYGSTGCVPQCDQCGGCEGCCRCCLCGPPGRFWIRDEYMGFFTKGDSLPVLVTTAGPTGGLPATTPLYGGNQVNNGFVSGNWLQAGMWLDCCQQWGIQANYFFLGPQTANYYNSSDGSPILARPFIDNNPNSPGVSQELIAYPGTVVGSICIDDKTSFMGAGALLRHNLCCMQCCDPCAGSCGNSPGIGWGNNRGGCFSGQNCCRLDFLTGFQYYNLRDQLNITENLTSTSTTNGVPVGTQITVRDSFHTQNNFYGAALGLVLQKYRGRWVHELQGIVSLGSNVERISINGSTTTSFPGQTTSVQQGGLYALSTNIGNYSHSNFTAIPQISARLGYRLTERLTAYVGYTFIYWGQVALAGNQVSTTINSSYLPGGGAVPTGPASPAYSLHETGFWAQGITIGGQYNF